MFNLFDRDFYSSRSSNYYLLDEITGPTGLESRALKIKSFKKFLKCQWKDSFSWAWVEASADEDFSKTLLLHIRRVLRPSPKKKKKKAPINPIILRLKKLVKRKFTRFTSV